jgi:MoaA/NifB/PqqE/SkfB family radical SAM enzyme
MNRKAKKYDILKSLISNPRIINAKPAIIWFLIQYMNKFKVIDVDGNMIIHSHLPPLNSKAYSRFIKEHLIDNSIKPSHAQIGITNLCPQNCAYCYNKDRKGIVLDTLTIKKAIKDLKSMGVLWIGLTGGEPLMNNDIVDIIASIGDDCASKLFTTGIGLTGQLAKEMQQAGLQYVSVSLDHWKEEVHDETRQYKGAFREALNAIQVFKNLGNTHVSVSAVLSKEMIIKNELEEYLEFLKSLDIHEVWLSETKPTVETYFNYDMLISTEERFRIIELQDRYNKDGSMTINYLGHFESEMHFGCTAGHKMIYIDSFGEVSPCVFIPMSFGNIRESSIVDIYDEMSKYFPTEGKCFINNNFNQLRKYHPADSIISKQDSLKLMKDINFGEFSGFFKIHYKRHVV